MGPPLSFPKPGYCCSTQQERLRGLETELVSIKPDVIFALGGDVAPLVRAATRTIPTVTAVNVDPFQSRLVASPAPPSGNITGGVHSGPRRLTPPGPPLPFLAHDPFPPAPLEHILRTFPAASCYPPRPD